MKTPFRFAVLSLSLVGLTACASMDDDSASLSPQATPMTSDQLYMAQVEKIARRRGIEVVWVNPPPPKREELLADE
jgi:hypothetical protein